MFVAFVVMLPSAIFLFGDEKEISPLCFVVLFIVYPLSCLASVQLRGSPSDAGGQRSKEGNSRQGAEIGEWGTN